MKPRGDGKMQKRIFAAMAMGVLLVAAGCKRQPAAAPQQQYTAIDMSTAGTITGTVHYTKTPPKPVEIDMAQDPACTLSGVNLSEGTVVNNGGLANVFIYVKDGLGNKIYAAPTKPVDIDQKGC